MTKILYWLICLEMRAVVKVCLEQSNALVAYDVHVYNALCCLRCLRGNTMFDFFMGFQYKITNPKNYWT